MSLSLERLEKATKELDRRGFRKDNPHYYDHEGNDLRILIENAAKEIREQDAEIEALEERLYDYSY